MSIVARLDANKFNIERYTVCLGDWAVQKMLAEKSDGGVRVFSDNTIDLAVKALLHGRARVW